MANLSDAKGKLILNGDWSASDRLLLYYILCCCSREQSDYGIHFYGGDFDTLFDSLVVAKEPSIPFIGYGAWTFSATLEKYFSFTWLLKEPYYTTHHKRILSFSYEDFLSRVSMFFYRLACCYTDMSITFEFVDYEPGAGILDEKTIEISFFIKSPSFTEIENEYTQFFPMSSSLRFPSYPIIIEQRFITTQEEYYEINLANYVRLFECNLDDVFNVSNLIDVYAESKCIDINHSLTDYEVGLLTNEIGSIIYNEHTFFGLKCYDIDDITDIPTSLINYLDKNLLRIMEDIKNGAI
jgi:hypothetical protein